MNEHIQDLLLSIIRKRIEQHPRSLQKEIGPSEIGHPCTRWLAYKLNDTPKVNTGQDKWRATVGVAVHKWLGDAFESYNQELMDLTGKSVFHVEERVCVGHVYNGDGYVVYGGCDLYFNRIVVDWKIVGPTTLDEARRHGAEPKYRTQVHSYGRGWQRQGYPVDAVAVFFLPACGTLAQGVWWCVPYDESECVAALERVSEVQKLVNQHGSEAPALAAPTAHHCERCEWFRPKAKDPTVACPGVDVVGMWDGLLIPES
jgi:hypothetical protein